MAIHKAKVIGQLPVCGVAPGGTIPDLDDELVNLQVLISARLVALIPEPEKAAKPKRATTTPKGDD